MSNRCAKVKTKVRTGHGCGGDDIRSAGPPEEPVLRSIVISVKQAV
jgi:hypothetical protein